MDRLLFLGDFCVSSQIKPTLAPNARDLFESADLICVNIEAPVVSSVHHPVSKVGPVIGQSTLAVDLCREFGVSHLTLANNHIMDYGRDGLLNTLDQFDGMAFLGAGLSFDQAYTPYLFEKSGTRIAMLSFAEAQFGVLQDDFMNDFAGVAWIDHPRARQAVREARGFADFVIVQVHAGLEMVDLPLPEWRIRYRELIDLGADLVVCHHPHVIQGSECYKGKMIYYSLGNFYMLDALGNGQFGSGAVLVVNVEGDTVDSELIPLRTSACEIDLDTTGEESAQYQRLCRVLSDNAEYIAQINKVCDVFWQQVYARYYESALFGLGTRPSIRTAYQLLRRLAGRFVYGKRVSSTNELLLLHNIRIESHRWAVERALRNAVGELV